MHPGRLSPSQLRGRRENPACAADPSHSVSGQKSLLLFYNSAHSLQILRLLYLNGCCRLLYPPPFPTPHQIGELCKLGSPGLHSAPPFPALALAPLATLCAFLAGFLLPPTLKPGFGKSRLKGLLFYYRFLLAELHMLTEPRKFVLAGVPRNQASPLQGMS